MSDTQEQLDEARAKLEDKQEEIDNFEPEIDDDDYETLLDDIYGDIEICGMVYSAGRALRELDPTAFRCGRADHEGTAEHEDFATYNNLQTELEEIEDEIALLEEELEDD